MSLLRQLALRRAHAAALLAAAATGAAGPAAQQQWAGGLHCLLLAMRHGSSSSSSSSSSSAGPDQLPPLRWPSPCSHPRPVRAAAADARPQPPSALQELGLPPQLLEGLQRQGVTSPTPVQAAALAHVLQGRHVAVQSPTGTGKTFAYLLPLLARSQPWRKQQQGVQALVLAPTQELCMQVLRSARALVGVAAGKRIQPVVGGANPRRQVEALTLHKPVMLVCTPGRLAKLLQRQGLAKLLLQRPGSRGKEPPPLRRLTLVLEEADKLLMMGDFRDLARLLSGCDSTGAAMAHLLVQHQVLLVSASLKPATLAAVPAWAHADAVTVSAERALQPAAAAAAPAAAEAPLDDGPSCSSDSGSSAATAGDTAEQQQQQPVLEQLRPRAVQMLPDSLQHQVLGYARSKRLERVLQQCLQACMQQSKKALVFVGTNASLVGLYEQLAATRMQVGCLHGRLPARERQRVLTRFNRGALRVLLLSDAFALGLDFRGVDVVLQASMPASAKQYVHRAGRAGRMGAAGTVLTVLPEDAVNAAKQQLRRLKLDVQEVVLRRDERDRPAVVPAAEAA